MWRKDLLDEGVVEVERGPVPREETACLYSLRDAYRSSRDGSTDTGSCKRRCRAYLQASGEVLPFDGIARNQVAEVSRARLAAVIMGPAKILIREDDRLVPVRSVPVRLLAAGAEVGTYLIIGRDEG